MIRTCAACGQLNRVPARHLAKRGKCGACKAELPPLGEPVEADRALFDEVVEGAQVPVFVDFWATWCGPCRMVAPEVQKLATRFAGKALVLKVDTDKEGEVAGRFGIQSIPTFMVFKDGKPVVRESGARSELGLAKLVEQAA
ncbi:MAG TPA: thioredoxin [Polyangiaceae bacterium]|nr:thioredoxin [Polyangiaceae bacterium]